jgi:hypothetical protein
VDENLLALQDIFKHVSRMPLTEACAGWLFSDSHYSHSTGGNWLVVSGLMMCSCLLPQETQIAPIVLIWVSLSISFSRTASQAVITGPLHFSQW